MRIITGSAKGFKLKAPKGLDVRPTGDRVKESVFNIIAGYIPEAFVLDLFAGTGNLGLEALSRGASRAVFVDNAMSSLNIVKENAVHTRLSTSAEYIKADAVKAIKRLHEAGRQFRLIFCDPPYNKGFVQAVLTELEQYPLLQSGGLVIIEHSRRETLAQPLRTLRVVREEVYGETVVTFLANEPD